MNKSLLALSWMLVLTSICFLSCESDPQGPDKSATGQEVINKRKIPAFQADSAYAYVKKQVDFGIRLMGTPTHVQCKDWLAAKLKSFGAEVIEQDFDANVYTGEKLPATNVIGQYNPDANKRILLCAHWDSRHIAEEDPDEVKKKEPILGADDGASGVGVLLEVARLLGENEIDMGVDIIFFDAEDHGQNRTDPNATQKEILDNMRTWCLGSQHWGANKHKANYKAKYGILLDMVGAKNARFPKEEYSLSVAPGVVNKTWKLAKAMGFGNHFVEERDGPITDDHVFVHQVGGVPTIDIINMSNKPNQTFGNHWHTHDDNMDVIDKRTLKAVGRVLTAVIYKENNGEF